MKWLLFLLILSPPCFGQEEGKHRISVVPGHAHIRQGLNEDGEKHWLVRAAWGLDYDFWLNEKWGLGFHNDIILEDFSVDGEDEVMKRSFPVASCLTGIFKPGKHLSFILGAGAEFASEGNLFLMRAGADYGWDLRGGWEVAGSLSYDIKWHSYDTWLLGIGISKRLGGTKK